MSAAKSEEDSYMLDLSLPLERFRSAGSRCGDVESGRMKLLSGDNADADEVLPRREAVMLV